VLRWRHGIAGRITGMENPIRILAAMVLATAGIILGVVWGIVNGHIAGILTTQIGIGMMRLYGGSIVMENGTCMILADGIAIGVI